MKSTPGSVNICAIIEFYKVLRKLRQSTFRSGSMKIHSTENSGKADKVIVFIS